MNPLTYLVDNPKYEYKGFLSIQERHTFTLDLKSPGAVSFDQMLPNQQLQVEQLKPRVKTLFQLGCGCKIGTFVLHSIPPHEPDNITFPLTGATLCVIDLNDGTLYASKDKDGIMFTDLSRIDWTHFLVFTLDV